MKTIRYDRFAVPIAVLALLAVAVHAGGFADIAAAGPVAQGTAAAAGSGFWEMLSCMGCIGAFVIGAGTTIAGLAIFLASNPEIAILCVSACSSLAT